MSFLASVSGLELRTDSDRRPRKKSRNSDHKDKKSKKKKDRKKDKKSSKKKKDYEHGSSDAPSVWTA